MRIVIISDTHGQQDRLPKLEGDLLIHCGDLCRDDGGADLPEVDAWFGRQPFAHRLCVAGNHDFLLERLEQIGEPTLSHAMLLHDQAVEIEGVKIYGAPWVPDLPGWAYNLEAEPRRTKWDLIPDDTDLLVTHTPPRGVLDVSGDPPESSGCPLLAKRVQQVSPRIHCFGHVHASFGSLYQDGTEFINAAQIRGGKICNQPVVVDW